MMVIAMSPIEHGDRPCLDMIKVGYRGLELPQSHMMERRASCCWHILQGAQARIMSSILISQVRMSAS